jgi:hypothetical protein
VSTRRLAACLVAVRTLQESLKPPASRRRDSTINLFEPEVETPDRRETIQPVAFHCRPNKRLTVTSSRAYLGLIGGDPEALCPQARGERARNRRSQGSTEPVSGGVGYCLGLSICLDIWFRRRRARVVMERSAKPFTPVQFRASPPRNQRLSGTAKNLPRQLLQPPRFCPITDVRDGNVSDAIERETQMVAQAISVMVRAAGFGPSPNMSHTPREHRSRSNCYWWPAARRGNWLIVHAMPAQSDQRRVVGARRKALEAWRSNHLIRGRHRRRSGTCIARPTKRYGSASSRRPTNATLLRRWQRSATFRQAG